MSLLAILGRGIQQEDEGGPWAPTQDLEVCDENFAHFPICKPINDLSPYSIIGGGELNLAAAVEFCRGSLDVEMVAFSYVWRAKYLVDVNGPTESEIMSSLFQEAMGDHPPLKVWEKDRTGEGASNTKRELINTFELVKKEGIDEMTIITVSVHLPRTMVFSRGYLTQKEFQHMKVHYVAAEEVLERADPDKYLSRCRAMRSSRSYRRNYEIEAQGIFAELLGTYEAERYIVKVGGRHDSPLPHRATH